MRTGLIASVLLSPAVLAQSVSQPNPTGGVAAGGAPIQALSPAQEARAQAIGRTIRCPVCQGLPITESPSDLSQSMLRELRDQVRAGQSGDQITTYFAARYGDTVLLDPPRRGVNLLLWLGPLAAALAGGGWLLSTVRRRGAVTSGPVQREVDDSADDVDEAAADSYLAEVRAQVQSTEKPIQPVQAATLPAQPVGGGTP
ncbi:cytochrome c-type biogenesis protein [Deinococcus sp.]|uniref:cytochrome c-type biogenesis protein n=1 Tax=Deinococcus sp. TaxID=47478 RepID=UPI003C7E6A28